MNDPHHVDGAGDFLSARGKVRISRDSIFLR